jgi:hypothetical protein
MTVAYISSMDSSSSEIQKNGAKPAAAGFSEVLAKQLPQSTPFEVVFLDAGREYDVNPALLKAVASAESDFNPDAVSPAGAVGLMQIMPETAQQLGIDPQDPVQSIQGAANYLRTLLDQFNGNMTLAVAAYNAGPGAVAKYGGIPPYRETQDYVVHVADLMKKYSYNGTGSDPGSYQEPGAGRQAPGAGLPSGAARGGAAQSAAGSQQDAAGLADLLMIWTENQRMNALSELNSDDANGMTPAEDNQGSGLLSPTSLFI